MAANCFKDETGKRFGRLTVLRADRNAKGRRAWWVCRCDCGNEKSVVGYRLRSQITRSCGCLFRDVVTKKVFTATRRRRALMTMASYLARARRGADLRGLDFDITEEYASALLEAQQYRCAYSGLAININDAASLDRIDSSKGYIPGNVQWLHRYVNVMKSSHSHELFLRIAHMIAENTPKPTPGDVRLEPTQSTIRRIAA